MSTFTENYNLIKPDETDYYDVTDFNENMDTIDSQLLSTEQEIEGVNEKIGTATDEGAETLFSKLNQIHTIVGQGVSLVKSIQRVIVSMSTYNKNTTKNISAVDTSRSFVIMERLSQIEPVHDISYTLSSTSLSISTNSTYDKTISLGFWIIEFY